MIFDTKGEAGLREPAGMEGKGRQAFPYQPAGLTLETLSRS